MSSSAPRSLCTECKESCRTTELRSYSMCHQHRLCPRCRAAHPQAAGNGAYECPICDESRRRLGARVRTNIWAEQSCKVQCVVCDRHGPGALMRCGHGYCPPCLRKQPRTLQSRTLSGEMARACSDCEKKANKELLENAREAMERAEDTMKMARDHYETREMSRDLKMVKEREQQVRRPRKAPAKRPLTVPVGPSFMETDADGNSIIAKPVWSKIPSSKPNPPTSLSTDATTAKRKVSFDPLVRQKLISPRERSTRTRHSLPASFSTGASTSLEQHTSRYTNTHPRVSELSTSARSSHRGWGISSP